jgi:alpha-glucosidase
VLPERVHDQPWWKSAVVYQIYPRSFQDSDGDGVGDLEGIRRRLDHLAWLGVDAVWLSPFFRSPMADFGYDVADHCDVDPLFGTLADFDDLVARAHELGIRVLIDWVPNHTSDHHSWFIESRSSRSSSRRDWYVWRDGRPDRPPNNWQAAFSDGPTWSWDDSTQQWYLHLFLPEQPDLNWANPAVVEAMQTVLRFWLDRGVDGFRADAVHAIGKDPALPDAPEKWKGMPWSALNDHQATHDILRQLRRLIDSYPGDRVIVGEVFLLSTAAVARYYGSGDELHLAFNFPPLFAPWEADAWRHRIDRVVEELDPRGAWPTWVLSNHDNPRHRTRYGGSEDRARAAAVLLLTMRGTPFIYAGEELGLENAEIPADRRLDPGGRDGSRAPLPWDGSSDHGWPPGDQRPGAGPWLPWPPEAEVRNVAAMHDDPKSILNLYRRLLAARRGSRALSVGSWSPLPTPPDVLAYQRAADNDRRLVIVNFGDSEAAIPVPDGAWRVEVSTEGEADGVRYSGVVRGPGAVVLTAEPS